MEWTNSLKNRLLYSYTIILLLLFNAVSCSSRKSSNKDAAEKEVNEATGPKHMNTLTPSEQKEGWVLLFDGQTTDKWRKVYGDSFPAKDWMVKNGTLAVGASNGRQGGSGGSIVSKDSYRDFELQLDFKLTKGANSGIKYFVVENPAFFDGDPAGRGLGLEYQIIDDARPDVHANTSTGSLYDMIPASNDKTLRPIGEWNHVKIISKGHHVEHWLNGQKVLAYQRGSDDYKDLVAKSKYSRYSNFGLAREGHILLQDHGSTVSYRNIKIRKI